MIMVLLFPLGTKAFFFQIAKSSQHHMIGEYMYKYLLQMLDLDSLINNI